MIAKRTPILLNSEDLSWLWECFRYKVSAIEKDFLNNNKNKYNSNFELIAALDTKLKNELGEEKKKLLELQASLNIRR